MSIDKIRAAILRAGSEVPSTGPDYVERINRIRRWMLDLAEEMIPIHVAVNEHGMDIDAGVIERAVDAARYMLAEDYVGGRDRVRGALNVLATGVAEAFHYEEVARYSPSYSASRAALQAIHSAVSATGDFDIFSLAAKATLVAEESALAIAYRTMADENDASPSGAQVARALSNARKDVGMAFFGGLHCRIYDDVRRPLDLQSRGLPPAAM